MSFENPTTATTGRIIFEILRLGGRLTAAGDALVGDIGLSSARWQVLSTAQFLPDPGTVSDIAQSLGLARQSVQRVVNELEVAGLVTLADNPAHLRARLVVPSEAGRAALTEAETRRQSWTDSLAEMVDPEDAATAERVLIQLRRALDR
ncbi:MarR family winged helix-turn-helix transcriptional regulator [Pseudooceanicola spongiae]|jgi:DNA-binding MarR family transcriptional regulator|nr:MarR family winged helix-turn-helix transcriptional regulator [Pseudooceanicola spongiae]